MAYGIVLRSSEYTGFKELGEYVYTSIFDKDDIVEHLQIRDYAKLTVEYLKTNKFITIDISKTKPPYGSKLPDRLPTNNELDKYKTNIWNKRIISSMVTEYGNGIMSYGDFGRYKFEYGKTFKMLMLKVLVILQLNIFLKNCNTTEIIIMTSSNN